MSFIIGGVSLYGYEASQHQEYTVSYAFGSKYKVTYVLRCFILIFLRLLNLNCEVPFISFNSFNFFLSRWSKLKQVIAPPKLHKCCVEFCLL